MIAVGHRFCRYHIDREKDDRVCHPEWDLDYHSAGQGEPGPAMRSKAGPDGKLTRVPYAALRIRFIHRP
jgi:hypothetical protein